MKKTLIPGMFSSVSDAELVTAMLDAADYYETIDAPDQEIYSEVEKNTDKLQN